MNGFLNLDCRAHSVLHTLKFYAFSDTDKFLRLLHGEQRICRPQGGLRMQSCAQELRSDADLCVLGLLVLCQQHHL